jgi:hypothetical protein
MAGVVTDDQPRHIEFESGFVGAEVAMPTGCEFGYCRQYQI